MKDSKKKHAQYVKIFLKKKKTKIKERSEKNIKIFLKSKTETIFPD